MQMSKSLINGVSKDPLLFKVEFLHIEIGLLLLLNVVHMRISLRLHHTLIWSE